MRLASGTPVIMSLRDIPKWLQTGTRRSLSGTACKDGPLADQRDDYGIGPRGQAGSCRRGRRARREIADPRVREPVPKSGLSGLRRAKPG
jgi:hypothetical protein